MRYHSVLDGLAVDAAQADRIRRAAAAVEEARSGGVPAGSGVTPSEPALNGAEDRLAIEPPEVSQVPALQSVEGEIVEAELVEPRENLR